MTKLHKSLTILVVHGCLTVSEKVLVETQSPNDGSLEIRLNRYAEFDRINGPYLDWQFEQFRPYLGDRVLEIGCGVGGILERMPRCSLITSLDVEADVLSVARQRFADRAECQFALLDISTCDDSDLSMLKSERFDTVLAINVLEHIQDDKSVLQRVAEILVPGGHLILLVPAHQALYGQYDKLDGHFRRYNSKLLRSIISGTSFEVASMKYFNLVGAIGWWIHYCLLKKSIHGAGQFWLMNRIIGVMRHIERSVPPPFGLSVIAILRRPDVDAIERGI